jgi:hypothetical protein
MLKNLASSFAMSMYAKNSVASLANVWLELGGRGGLRSTYRRVHAMAVDLVALFERS